PVDALRPESRYRDKHFQAIFCHVFLVSRVAYIIVYRVCDSSVPVNFFERDFPLVMTFLPVHRHHGVQSSAVAESQLLGILNCLLEMFVSIHEQVSGNTLRSCAEEERKAICFSVPICASAVLFTGKTLGTDIQTFIIS